MKYTELNIGYVKDRGDITMTTPSKKDKDILTQMQVRMKDSAHISTEELNAISRATGLIDFHIKCGEVFGEKNEVYDNQDEKEGLYQTGWAWGSNHRLEEDTAILAKKVVLIDKFFDNKEIRAFDEADGEYKNVKITGKQAIELKVELTNHFLGEEG